mmetsp:Transcript_9343/g.13846  ORF Transcript_9343/g.13846 Transcript_9343/m.13846 type:complete len:92 (-) Transcript_9343:685-960(-)
MMRARSNKIYQLCPRLRSKTKEEANERDNFVGGEVEEASADTNAVDEQSTKRVKVCARPFAVMKGHTAFLTFATASLRPYCDPQSEEKKID